MIQKLCLLALAGAAGTLAQYGLAGLVHRINGISFPKTRHPILPSLSEEGGVVAVL